MYGGDPLLNLERDLFESDHDLDWLRRAASGQTRVIVCDLDDLELEWLARWPQTAPYLLRLIVKYCQYNDKQRIGALAIINPNIDVEDLILLLKQGREEILRAGSYKAHNGHYWLFTKGIQNPVLDLATLERPDVRCRLDDLLGCPFDRYLR